MLGWFRRQRKTISFLSFGSSVDGLGDRKSDIKPLGKASLGYFHEVGGWGRNRSAVECKTFEMEFESFAEVGTHLFEGMAGTGAAWNIGREAAHIRWAVLVDDKVASRHGFNPACFRIL